MFNNCVSLSDIRLPELLETIGIFCFNNCTSLTSIIIPESVSLIEGGAFCSCTSLTSVQLPKLGIVDAISGIQASVTYTHEIREGEKKCACGENQIAEEEKPCTHNDCCLDYLVGSLYRLLSELLDSIFDYYFWF